jgi:hypothetical protein
VEGIPDEPFRADSREPNEDSNRLCRALDAGPDGKSWRVGVAGKETIRGCTQDAGTTFRAHVPMTADPSQLEHIAGTLGFTLNELALNRLGQISTHQGWEVARAALGFSGFAIAAIGAIPIVIFLVKPVGLWRLAYLPISLGAVLLVVIASQFVAGAWHHKVASAEGPLDFQNLGRAAGIVIGKARVLAPKGFNDVLTEGEYYRLYYVRGLDQFLSIEPALKAP